MAPYTAVAMHQTGDRISCHIGLDAPNRVDAMSEERLQMCQDVLVTKPFQVQGTLQKEGTKESKDPALNLL